MNFEEASSSNLSQEYKTTSNSSSKPKTPTRQSSRSESSKSSQYKLANEGQKIECQSNKNGNLEGFLLKHTNVMKGYQIRYFVVDERRGVLEYYVPEEKRKLNHVRGSLSLIDCNIAPSEDDSLTFIVSNSEVVYRLKASNTKERQKWVDKLRQVALNLSENLEKDETKNTHLNDVRESLLMSQKNQIKLVNAIENFSSLDKEILILKSTSYSSVMALENCFAILQSLKPDLFKL